MMKVKCAVCKQDYEDPLLNEENYDPDKGCLCVPCFQRLMRKKGYVIEAKSGGAIIKGRQH